MMDKLEGCVNGGSDAIFLEFMTNFFAVIMESDIMTIISCSRSKVDVKRKF
jgi:hypothetical protein